MDFEITEEMIEALPEDQRGPWLDHLKRVEEHVELIESEAQARNFKHALVLVDSKDRARYMIDFDERFSFTKEEARDLLDMFWSITEAWSGDERLREGMYGLLKRVAPLHVLGEPPRPMPEKKWLTIYRGNLGETPGAHMMSWTLDRSIAEMFARMAMSPRGMFLGMHRKDGLPSIWRGVIHRTKVMGYFDDRDEQEVVVDGQYLQQVELIAQAVRPDKEEE